MQPKFGRRPPSTHWRPQRTPITRMTPRVQATWREPIKRSRAVSDLYHAADLIRAHSGANNLAAEVERIADRIAASSDATSV